MLKEAEIDYLKEQNAINVYFEKWLKKLELMMEQERLIMRAYHQRKLWLRILQIFTTDNFRHINKNFSSVQKRGMDQYQNNYWNIQGSIKISASQVFKNYLLFLAYLLKFYFLGLCQMARPMRRKFGKNIVIFDVSGFDQLFNDELMKTEGFFQKGNLPFLHGAEHYFFSSTLGKRVKNASWVKNAWLDLLSGESFSLFDVFFFSFNFLNTFFNFSVAIIRKPMLSLLYRDMGFEPLINTVDAKKIVKHYAITNTLGEDHLLSICGSERNFKTHIVFYSVNSKPMKYIFHGQEYFAQYPYFRHLLVDQAWVWDEDQIQWLRDYRYLGAVSQVGPILFYLPKIAELSPRNDKKVVTVFDLTPFSYEHLGIHQGRFSYNYFNEENCLKFISDIVQVFPEWIIQIKPKRDYLPGNSKTYIDLLKKLEAEGRIKVLDHRSNIFEVISASDLVVTIPYSSPALVAPTQGVPSIYYDSTGFLVCDYKLPKEVYFCSGKEDLKAKVESLSHSR